MIRTSVSSLMLLLGCNGAYCQSTPKLEFEVASIKPSPPAAGRGEVTVIAGCYGGPGNNDPSLFVCQNASLSNIMTVGVWDRLLAAFRTGLDEQHSLRPAGHGTGRRDEGRFTSDASESAC